MDRFIKRDNIKIISTIAVQNSAMELGADFFFFFRKKRKVNIIFTRALRPHIDSDQTSSSREKKQESILLVRGWVQHGAHCRY